MSKASDGRRTAATALGEPAARRGGRGRLKWLLPLLALLLLAGLLIGFLGGDDDTNTGPGTSAAATPSPAADSTSPAAGVLTAGGQTLRAGAPETLTAAVGQQATGRSAKVLSVVGGTGFWVGDSDNDRTFIEYGSSVGSDESQPYKPKVGDVVDLQGEVRPAPEDPAQTLKLSAADAERLTGQGAYINADEVQAR